MEPFSGWPEERPTACVTRRRSKLLAPGREAGDGVGLAVRCPACGKGCRWEPWFSRAHVDVPFVNDREVGVVEHHFHDDAASDRCRVPGPSSGRAPSERPPALGP